MQDAAASEFDDLFAAAMDHRRAGRLAEAEALYRRILATRPENTKAQAGLGVVLLRRGQAGEALALLEGAARTDLEAMEPYARGLIMCGRFETAEGLLAAQPVALKAVEPFLRQAWGASLMAQGKLDLAEAQLQKAADLLPDDIAVRLDLAVAQLNQARFEAGEQSARRALAIQPTSFAAHVHLATALRGQERHPEAVQALREAMALGPEDPRDLRNLAVLLNGEEMHAEALAYADRLLARGLDPGALAIKATALHGLGDYEAALDTYRQAQQLSEDPASLLGSIAQTQAAVGRIPEALATYDAAVGARPHDPRLRQRRGMARLMAGDFEGGWPDYEARWGDEASPPLALEPAFRAAEVPLRRWLSLEDVTDRVVLVVGEQGIGDQIMFASMLPELAAVARKVICIVDKRLVRLMSHSLPQVSFPPPEAGPAGVGGYEVAMAIGSLGHIFRRRAELFSGAPYLHPSPDALGRWSARLPPKPPGGLRIGLSWGGGTPRTRQRMRSAPLAAFAPLLRDRRLQAVSLQHGDPRDEVRDIDPELRERLLVFEPQAIDDIDDLAGLIGNLDLVVSVQNTLVHLAGALGKPCLAALPSVPEWRYMAEGPSMPWYRSVRLFRQGADRTWDPVIREVVAAISGFAAA